MGVACDCFGCTILHNEGEGMAGVNALKRWFQFRISTLLLLTTIVAMGLGWWDYSKNSSHRVSQLTEQLTLSAANEQRLSQEVKNSEQIHQILFMLDPYREDTAETLRVLSSLEWSKAHESPLQRLEFFEIPSEPGKTMDVVIAEVHGPSVATKGASSVVLLFLRAKHSQFGAGRQVDALSFGTSGGMRGYVHNVSWRDQDGDGEKEIVFHGGVSDGWGTSAETVTEAYLPTPEGFVKIAAETGDVAAEE